MPTPHPRAPSPPASQERLDAVLAEIGAMSHAHPTARIVESAVPDADVQLVLALSRSLDGRDAEAASCLAVVVPARRLDAFYRALGKSGAAIPVCCVRWGDGPWTSGPLVLVDERVFFDGLMAETFGHPLPDFDHWIFAEGDGLIDRLRRAFRTHTRDAQVCGFLEAQLGLSCVPGSRHVVPTALLARPELAAVPLPWRADPNRVFTLCRTRRRRELRSDLLDPRVPLDAFWRRTSITVCGRALSVGPTLDFARRQLGWDAIKQPGDVVRLHPDPHTMRADVLLFTPRLPSPLHKEWPTHSIAALRKVVTYAPDATVLSTGWSREAVAQSLRSRLSTTIVLAHPDRPGPQSSLVVLDRLPLSDDLPQPPHAAAMRHFIDDALPTAVQRFRRVASRVAPGGVLAVLDGRMHTRWAHAFRQMLPGEATSDWKDLATWVDPTEGGAP